MTLAEISAMENVVFWLESCLNCETFIWDGDQREAAEAALIEAKRRLLEYQGR